MANNKETLNKIIFSAIFLAVGMVLPLFTMQIKEIGDTLLPMHLPVMLCGLVCGAKYGFVIGFLLPVLRSVIFGMPPLYPNSLWMAAELSTYGLVIGILYFGFFKKQMWWLYCSLIISMLSGRVVWGIVKSILLGVAGESFTLMAFVMGGFLDAIPGIILQLILIPVIMTIILRKRDSRI